MIIHSSQFIEITSVHCHTLEPVQFCLIVGLIVCLIFEGVACYVERIRQARYRQANERWRGNDGNNLHKYTDRHHFLHTLVIDTMLVNLIFSFLRIHFFPCVIRNT